MCTVDDCVLGPGERRLLCTGVALEIPRGYVGLVWDRSGLGVQGLTTFGGVIDCTYRGELKVVLFNASDTAHHVKRGDRIAQLLIQRVETVRLVEVDTLTDTERGERGFGSSGR